MNFLEDLRVNGHLDETAIVFMGDHGIHIQPFLYII